MRSVYVIFAIEAGKSFAGKVYVTDRYVRFDSQFELGMTKVRGWDNLMMVGSDRHLALPYDQIASAEVKKQFLIMKNLVITLKSGDVLTFRFGAMSRDKTQQAITERLA